MGAFRFAIRVGNVSDISNSPPPCNLQRIYRLAGVFSLLHMIVYFSYMCVSLGNVQCSRSCLYFVSGETTPTRNINIVNQTSILIIFIALDLRSASGLIETITMYEITTQAGSCLSKITVTNGGNISKCILSACEKQLSCLEQLSSHVFIYCLAGL